MNRVCILISSPLSYKDAFDISISLFEKYWKNCPYDKIYATDFSHEFSHINSNFKTITSNNFDDWKHRVKYVLNQLSYDYVILLTDDLFLKNVVNQNDFSELMNYIMENKILYTRLYKSTKIKKSKNKIKNEYYKLLYNQPYCRSLLGGIWNKQHLETILSSSNLDAWMLEERWNQEGIMIGSVPIPQHLYYHNDYFIHAIYKGKWFRKVKRFLKINNVDPVSKRKYISIKTSILIFLKEKSRNILPPKMKYFIKRILSKIIKFDTKY